MTSANSEQYDNLEKALNLLRKNIADFTVRAISFNDFKPVEEKIEIIRETLKRLRARVLALKVRKSISESHNKPVRTVETSNEMLQNIIARKLISDNALKQCCQSIVIDEVMVLKTHKEIYKQMYERMKELFLLNETILSLHNSITIAFKKQLDLKIQCQKEIINYRKFLKEQAELRNQRLQRTVPRVVRNRERLMTTMRRINSTKKFITNLIATSGKFLQEPFLIEMLEEHAELLTEETIIKITENEKLLNKETVLELTENEELLNKETVITSTETTDEEQA